jgi:hypothetical protein
MRKSDFILQAAGGKAACLLLAASALIAGWLAIFGGFVFYSDGAHFLNNATAMSHFQSGNYAFTSGYPLIILLTGYPLTGSVVPLLIVQAAFATLTPWLAFKTFARLDKWCGILAGLICLGSLTPFFFENFFYHDGTSLFFAFVALALASAFFASRRPRYIYLSVAGATLAYFAQPALIGFVIGCGGAFAVFSLSDRRQLKHVALAIGLFAVAVIGSSLLQDWTMGRAPEQMGERLFYNVYLEGGPAARFSGPAADKLRSALIRFFGTHPSSEIGSYVNGRFRMVEDGHDDYQDFYGQYEGRPAALVDRIFAQPNREYYEMMLDVRDFPDGVPDRLFLNASIAFIVRHPIVVLGYVWENLVDLTVGRAWSLTGPTMFSTSKHPNVSYFFPTRQEVVLSRGVLPDQTYAFLTSRQAPAGFLTRLANAAWDFVYNDVRPVLFWSMLVGWLASFWRGRTACWTMSTVVASYAATMLVFSFFVSPEFRYQIPGMAITAFAAGTGIHAVASWIIRGVKALTFSAEALASRS